MILNACYSGARWKKPKSKLNRWIDRCSRTSAKTIKKLILFDKNWKQIFHFACGRRGGPGSGQGNDWYQFRWHCFDFTAAFRFGQNAHLSAQNRNVEDSNSQFEKFSVSLPPPLRHQRTFSQHQRQQAALSAPASSSSAISPITNPPQPLQVFLRCFRCISKPWIQRRRKLKSSWIGTFRWMQNSA